MLSLAGSGTNQQSMLRRLYNAVSVFDFISCLKYRSRESEPDDIYCAAKNFKMEPSESSCSTSMLLLDVFGWYDVGVVGHLGNLHGEIGHETHVRQVTDNPGSIMQKS